MLDSLRFAVVREYTLPERFGGDSEPVAVAAFTLRDDAEEWLAARPGYADRSYVVEIDARGNAFKRAG